MTLKHLIILKKVVCVLELGVEQKMRKCRYPKLAVTESPATMKVQTLFSIPRYPLNHITPQWMGKAGSLPSYKGRN